MNIETLTSDTRPLTACPVLVTGEDGELTRCGEPLVPIVTVEVVGNNYGSWSHYSIGFACGHTFDEMVSSERNADYI